MQRSEGRDPSLLLRVEEMIIVSSVLMNTSYAHQHIICAVLERCAWQLSKLFQDCIFGQQWRDNKQWRRDCVVIRKLPLTISSGFLGLQLQERVEVSKFNSTCVTDAQKRSVCPTFYLIKLLKQARRSVINKTNVALNLANKGPTRHPTPPLFRESLHFKLKYVLKSVVELIEERQA